MNEEILQKDQVRPGAVMDLGTLVLSEQDIIDFAKAFDPLPFHLDKEEARKTIFKDLIASGPHIFNLAYRTLWLPRFGRSIICGMGVSNWKFIRPVYAGQKIQCKLTVLGLKPDPKIGGTAINWQFDFISENGTMIQTLQTEVMHRVS